MNQFKKFLIRHNIYDEFVNELTNEISSIRYNEVSEIGVEEYIEKHSKDYFIIDTSLRWLLTKHGFSYWRYFNLQHIYYRQNIKRYVDEQKNINKA